MTRIQNKSAWISWWNSYDRHRTDNLRRDLHFPSYCRWRWTRSSSQGLWRSFPIFRPHLVKWWTTATWATTNKKVPPITAWDTPGHYIIREFFCVSAAPPTSPQMNYTADFNFEIIPGISNPPFLQDFSTTGRRRLYIFKKVNFLKSQ